MSVLNQDQTESSSGYRKEIDEAGISLLLDTVQIYIYQFPVKSSMRESCSNAIDSITERNIAKILLANPERISEFYVEREGDIYRDSRFDKDYYDPRYLSNDDNVYMTYVETGGSELRDKVIIKDNGVGLGGKRLEGYFKISYSSKRLSTKTLGTFGLGCKSPLATGVDYYSLKTAHNGKEFSFLIYKDKIDNCYSKWNLDGTLNDSITFSNGYVVYYKKTEEKNFVEISWDVKKHQKRDYIDAVKSQLLYFKNPLKFVVKHQDWDEAINFQATILQETDDYILAEQPYYSRPHLIIGGVCYGFIDFRELELDDRYGSLGLKINMEDITVTPSRESCVWDTKTKEGILMKYDNLAKSSEKLINDTLSKLGFVEWAQNCAAINTINSGASKELKILSNLASLTGFSALSLKYRDTKIKYSQTLSGMINSTYIETKILRKVREYSSIKRDFIYKLKYEDTNSSNALQTAKVYVQTGHSEVLKSAYLSKDKAVSLIIKASKGSGDEYKKIVKDMMDKVITYEEAVALVPDMKLLSVVEDEVKLKARIKEYVGGLYFLSVISEQNIPLYENIVVPADFKADASSEDEEIISEDAVDLTVAPEKIDYNKLRKLNGKILIQYPRIEGDTQLISSKTEMKLSDLQDCTDTIVYGTKEDLPLLHFLYVISREDKRFVDSASLPFQGNPRVCIISKQVEKHFRSYTHVEKYLFGADGNKLCDELKKIFTSRMISHKINGRNKYFSKLEEHSLTLKTTYEEITKYINDYNKVYGWDKTFHILPENWKKLLNNSISVQTSILNEGLEEATKACIEKFGDDDLIHVEVFEKGILDKLEWILDFDSVFGVLFSEIGCLNDYSAKITPALAMEIKEIIEIKRDRLEKDYPDLCC